MVGSISLCRQRMALLDNGIRLLVEGLLLNEWVLSLFDVTCWNWAVGVRSWWWLSSRGHHGFDGDARD